MNRTPVQMAADQLAIDIADYRNTMATLDHQKEQTRATRNKNIALAIGSGVRQVDAARIVGVSREQIRKIVNAHNKPTKDAS